jgi:hypothetical protein
VITPETLTDAMILRFGRGCVDGTATDAIGRHLCVVALGLFRVHDRSTPELVTEAKRRICDAINARTGAKP